MAHNQWREGAAEPLSSRFARVRVRVMLHNAERLVNHNDVPRQLGERLPVEQNAKPQPARYTDLSRNRCWQFPTYQSIEVVGFVELHFEYPYVLQRSAHGEAGGMTNGAARIVWRQRRTVVTENFASPKHDFYTADVFYAGIITS
jgi:hypothetical protein